jgi:hypothetical protein
MKDALVWTYVSQHLKKDSGTMYSDSVELDENTELQAMKNSAFQCHESDVQKMHLAFKRRLSCYVHILMC